MTSGLEQRSRGAADVEEGETGKSMVMDDSNKKERDTPASGSLSLEGEKQAKNGAAISAMGLKVLLLLAVQNCSKNLLVRYVMKDAAKFLTSAAVIGSESTKLTLSILYILFVEKKSFHSIIEFLSNDWKTTMLVIVPASAYNLQMTLEYIAMANLDAAMFSVLVQSKLIFTATFAAAVLGKKLKKSQVISLVLLTTGVMLCNLSKMKSSSTVEDAPLFDAAQIKGIMATCKFRKMPIYSGVNSLVKSPRLFVHLANETILSSHPRACFISLVGIAVSSGFASVYTEKVIKSHKKNLSDAAAPPSLAYTQVQLASMSLVAIGAYAMLMDFGAIVEHGLFHNFTFGAVLTVLMSALGGLTVAAVLKFADSILKGYATALSVILTGVLSMYLFGTELNIIYFMGVINVIVAVLLYNGKDLEQMIC